MVEFGLGQLVQFTAEFRALLGLDPGAGVVVEAAGSRVVVQFGAGHGQVVVGEGAGVLEATPEPRPRYVTVVQVADGKLAFACGTMAEARAFVLSQPRRLQREYAVRPATP